MVCTTIDDHSFCPIYKKKKKCYALSFEATLHASIHPYRDDSVSHPSVEDNSYDIFVDFTLHLL